MDSWSSDGVLSMRVVRVHNQYQIPGGEDVVAESETRLLEECGHSVFRLTVTNNILDVASLAAKARLSATTVWSPRGRHLVSRACREHQADVVHFDNTLPLISPAAYYLPGDLNVAVVQTLHNYRHMCPTATFYRDGRICEDCLGKTPPYPGVVHGCYRRSQIQTGVVATMLTMHRLLRTYTQRVDRYIALTEFARGKFIEGGLPVQKIVVKPNFVRAPKIERTGNGPHFLFVGRLSPEKGIRTLLAAQGRHGQELRIAGDGPLAKSVAKAADQHNGLRVLGCLDNASVRTEMFSARALVFPSEWYEGFPVTLVEAFAAGLPVIASRLGSMAEIVEEGITGLHFDPGNPDDLAAKIRWASGHPGEMSRMGENARLEYEVKYTPECNYEMLMDIYREAIQHASK